MEGFLGINLITTGLKTLAMLLIVLAVLIGILFLLKKFSVFKRESKGEVPIKILSSLSLSTKDRIEVVEISDETIVLAVSPGGIKFLTKIDRCHEEN